jgi:dolichyl-phosphate beta-glucosyltransferase
MNISLIIPCYNEEANLQKGVLDKFGNFTINDDRFAEVIIIDDGSTDNSKQIIKEKYLKAFPKFKLIENKHEGKAFAINTGIKFAKGNFIFFSDIDLATPIEESEKLITETKNGYKVIIGSRQSRREGAPLLRKILSFGGNLVRSLLFNFQDISDTQCGFKLFEKKAADDIIFHSQLFKKIRHTKGPSVTAAFDLEFLFLAFKLGYQVKEVPVHWRHMETRNVNFLKDAMETLTDIISIKLYELQGKYRNI